MKTYQKIIAGVLSVSMLAAAGFFYYVLIEMGGASEGASRVFSVKPGESLNVIAQNLEREGLVRSALAFRAFVFYKKLQGGLQAGDYSLSASMSIPDIINKLAFGDVIKVRVTIPEGWNISQVEAALAEGFSGSACPDCEKKIVLSYFLTRDFKNRFPLLADAPDDATLEGFLYPDTYKFTLGDDHDAVARRMLKNFEAKLTPDLAAEIRRQGKTVFEIVTMASLIEKEVGGTDDKRAVSGVLWNRLKKGMPLQVDATLAYITKKRSTSFSVSETKIDSPYNTYVYHGLPRGPICNPGIESIAAAIYPQANDYFFYLSARDGTTIFSQTFQQHLVAKNRYLK